MGDRNESRNQNENEERPPKWKLSDKLWVGFAIGIFVLAFALILIFDLF